MTEGGQITEEEAEITDDISQENVPLGEETAAPQAEETAEETTKEETAEETPAEQPPSEPATQAESHEGPTEEETTASIEIVSEIPTESKYY